MLGTILEEAAEIVQIPTFWLIVGFTGQGLFALRFAVQWFVSEKSGRSTVPLVFWYFSILGGVIMMAYGIFRRDPVIIVGQSTGTVVYVRNLMLLYRERKTLAS